jgi:hypothetical protein
MDQDIATAPLTDAIATYLARCGYTERFRVDVWVECLVAGASDAFVGRGIDRAHARADALRQMLPSELARQAVALAIRSLEAEAGPSEGAPACQSAIEPEHPQCAIDVLGLDAAGETAADGKVDAEEQSDPAQYLEILDDPAPLPRDSLVAADTDSAVQRVFDQPIALIADPSKAAVPNRRLGRSTFQAHEALDDLIAEMTDAAEDVALYAAERMRLEMTVWLCRARAIQDASGDDEVYQRVRHHVAGQLTRWAKVYWPGSLPALRLTATPDDVAKSLGGTAQSWDEAADLATQVLTAATGDDYGWGDTEKVTPPHPGSVLGDVRKAIQVALQTDAEPGSDELGVAGTRILRTPEVMATLVRAARQLRWVRSVTPDPVLWGKCMGRLRWLAQFGKLDGKDALATALNAQTAPPGGWAKMLGYDAKVQEQKRKRAEVIRAKPAVGASSEAVIAWFQVAADVFDADELAPYIAHLSPVLFEMDGNVIFPGKPLSRVRDRLRKVQRRLREPTSIPLPPTFEEEPELPFEVRATSPIDTARDLVAGKTALVVGNRPDTHLQRHLAEQLGLEIDWCDASQRKTIGSACERIRGGRVDLVLTLTGFMSHTDEGPIKEAAKLAGVPYVPCFKGRVLATARGILRVHGRLAGV